MKFKIGQWIAYDKTTLGHQPANENTIVVCQIDFIDKNAPDRLWAKGKANGTGWLAFNETLEFYSDHGHGFMPEYQVRRATKKEIQKYKQVIKEQIMKCLLEHI